MRGTNAQSNRWLCALKGGRPNSGVYGSHSAPRTERPTAKRRRGARMDAPGMQALAPSAEWQIKPQAEE
eukprot:364126-Chlamydomonas_euryale.AAC.8